jgi:hypothetical protein
MARVLVVLMDLIGGPGLTGRTVRVGLLAAVLLLLVLLLLLAAAALFPVFLLLLVLGAWPRPALAIAAAGCLLECLLLLW